MYARIQIPDGLEIGKSIQGSIYLTANAEGSFRKYNISDKKRAKKAFRKLSHGRVTWTDDDVRLNIFIDRREHDIEPSDIVRNDCYFACDALEELDNE